MRAVIDTCVILDALQSRVPFEKDAQTIFLLAASEQFIGCITAKSVADLCYITHKHTHSDKETRSILNKLFDLFELIDTAGADCLHALPSAVSDYEDAIMAQTAKRIGADCIITRNEADYKAAGIKIYSPQAFIEALQAEADRAARFAQMQE